MANTADLYSEWGSPEYQKMINEGYSRVNVPSINQNYWSKNDQTFEVNPISNEGLKPSIPSKTELVNSLDQQNSNSKNLMEDRSTQLNLIKSIPKDAIYLDPIESFNKGKIPNEADLTTLKNDINLRNMGVMRIQGFDMTKPGGIGETEYYVKDPNDAKSEWINAKTSAKLFNPSDYELPQDIEQKFLKKMGK